MNLRLLRIRKNVRREREKDGIDEQRTAALHELNKFVGEWRCARASPGSRLRSAGPRVVALTESFLVQHADSQPSDVDSTAEWVTNLPFPSSCDRVDDESGEFSCSTAMPAACTGCTG